MSKAIEIRSVEPGDEQRFLDIMLRKVANNPDIVVSEDDFRHPINSVPAMVAASNSGDPKQGMAWLAYDPDKPEEPIGFISTKEMDGSYYVDPEYRRQGIAKALLDKREDFLVARGDETALVNIQAHNAGSLKVAFSRGYQLDDKSISLMEEWDKTSDEEKADMTKNFSSPLLTLTKKL
jgi:GNAT superfamily N-acetyltransferase